MSEVTTVQRGSETQEVRELSRRTFRATATTSHGHCNGWGATISGPVLVDVVVTESTVIAGSDRVGTVCTPSYHLEVDGKVIGGGGFARFLDDDGRPHVSWLILGTEVTEEPKPAVRKESWVKRVISRVTLRDTSIIVVEARDGGKWTLISTVHGEDRLVKPSGIVVDLDVSRDGALTTMACDMSELF